MFNLAYKSNFDDMNVEINVNIFRRSPLFMTISVVKLRFKDFDKLYFTVRHVSLILRIRLIQSRACFNNTTRQHDVHIL